MLKKIKLDAGLTVLHTQLGQWRDQGKRGRLFSAGERRSLENLHGKLTGTRGVAAGRVDSLGKEALEMLA